MKTYLPNKEDIKRNWLVVNAEDQIVGRLAVQIADTLRGKNKPEYTPHLDCGDFVIVTNAEKIKFSGRKNSNKIYQDYSGYMGGLKEATAQEMRDRSPERIIRRAVWGMLPKGRLGRQMFRKLKVYAGSEHPHASQQPKQMQVQG
jgi:large subunit ribosomal protein L13